jgi:hypothetical protein
MFYVLPRLVSNISTELTQRAEEHTQQEHISNYPSTPELVMDTSAPEDRAQATHRYIKFCLHRYLLLSKEKNSALFKIAWPF